MHQLPISSQSEASQHPIPHPWQEAYLQAPKSIAIADAKFGIMVDATVISSTSSFFFISQSLMSYFLKCGILTMKS